MSRVRRFLMEIPDNKYGPYFEGIEHDELLLEFYRHTSFFDKSDLDNIFNEDSLRSSE